jgi:hypothetical protein
MSPSHSNAPLSAKSWRAPLVILSALLAGLGFAIAHHLLGEHLDGRPVVDIPVSQAWVSRISTALAFLVKVALAVSVGTAYVQHQWLRFHKQSFKTKDVDALTGVLGNALSFVGSHIWLRHPLLTLMALISWFGNTIRLFSGHILTSSIGAYQLRRSLRPAPSQSRP